jgi:ABC-type transport system involved in multi-copper enzyme maturation permease subunit
MINGYDIKTVFSFFFRTGLRAKRTKLFFFFSFIPVIIFIIIRIVGLVNPQSNIPVTQLFSRITAGFYFQLFIQILVLFFGTSVLNDEIENKTLVYLTTSPVSKASIVTGKFIGNFFITSIIFASGLLITYLISMGTNLFRLIYLKQLGTFLGVAILAILTYNALFTLLGALLKRSILVGFFIIFGWERIVQFIPGTTQKLTISHYVNSMLPFQFRGGRRNFLTGLLQPSSTLESIITLIFLTLILLSLAIFVFYKKEFTLSDQS